MINHSDIVPANDQFPILFYFTDSLNSASGHSELLWWLGNPPAAALPKRCHDNCGAFNPTRKQRKPFYKNGRAREKLSDRHHKASVTCFCRNTLYKVTSLPLHPDCVSVFAFLSHENSFCGYSILTVFATLERPRIIVFCVGGRWVACWSIVTLLDRKNKSLLECHSFLTADTVDCLGWHLKMSCFLSDETWWFISSFAFRNWKVIYFIEENKYYVWAPSLYE